MTNFLFKNKKRGFTLTEMIVSIGIFLIVAIVAVGALLKIIDANKKAQSLKTSINNVNYLFETMSREMRVGSKMRCFQGGFSYTAGSVLTPLSCNLSVPPASNSWYIVFHSAKVYPKVGGGTCNLIHYYRFRFDTSAKLDGIIKGEQLNCEDTTFPNDFVSSPDAVITDLNIKVDTGASVGQPKAFIRLKGYSGIKEKSKTFFDLQTTISQRIDD